MVVAIGNNASPNSGLVVSSHNFMVKDESQSKFATLQTKEIDKAIKEHELSLLRLESVAEKNSTDMAIMKEQLTSEMTSLQSQNPLIRMKKIQRCEHFFAIDETPDRLKVRYASVSVEGRAVQWHNNYIKSSGGYLNQIGDLETYNDDFDMLLSKVDITEEHAISLYIEGLKPEIKCYVRLFKPMLLREAHSLARLQNNANLTMFARAPTQVYRPTNRPYFSPAIGSTSRLPLLPAPPIKANPINSFKPTTTRCLTSKEFDNKRARGECFWCSDKYTPGHKCTGNKQLYLFEVGEDGDEMIHADPNEECYSDTVQEQEPLISLHAITGIPSFSTMKVVGAIGTKALQILIDSGSTHNFVDDKLANKLNCTLLPINDIPVTVADGNKLSCVQVCKDFQWIMQGSWFKADMLVIPLSNYDVVLGIQWLQTLNDIVWNFKSLTMKFTLEDQPFELKGMVKQGVSLCSVTKLNSMLQTDQVVQAQLFCLQTDSQTSFQHEPKVINDQNKTDLAELLATFQDVFEVPVGLPPSRKCDHKIKLKDDFV
ncbi:hypothetical protein QVD17_16488 [Tagetes erecta]|uniref:Uncharacterized protein n=1 Tax=Tagetes erecta TaxID=13708 RepID=A0AAD8KUE6_TARER|nr:hypothetical protein QVD17_16488 [Tagetes erecta]